MLIFHINIQTKYIISMKYSIKNHNTSNPSLLLRNQQTHDKGEQLSIIHLINKIQKYGDSCNNVLL